MAQGYKGFKQIVRESNRQLAQYERGRELLDAFDLNDTVKVKGWKDKTDKGIIVDFDLSDDYNPKAIIHATGDDYTKLLDEIKLVEKAADYKKKFGFDFADIDALVEKGLLKHRSAIWYKIYLTEPTTKFGKEAKHAIEYAAKQQQEKELDKKKRFSAVGEIPRTSITTKPEWFQGREGAFAEETVEKIVGEGFDKSMEPIVLWKDGVGDNIVISGHSRFEASELLYKAGDKSLAKMPVKFFLGTKEEAMDYALLESNRGGTQEGLQSDLKAYKRAKEKGYNRNYLKGIFKPERRLKLLEDISHLNPNGDFIQYLDSDSEKSFPYLQRNAQWVGTIRKQNAHLTDAHEQEMFKYLYPVGEQNKARAKQKITITKDKFFDLVNKQISRIDFSNDQPLNLDNSVSTSPLTDPIREQINEVQKAIDKLVKERAKKDELIARATAEGKEEFIPKFKDRQTQITKLITQKLLEKQRLESEMGKVERTTTMDLFSDVPAQKEPKMKENKSTTANEVKTDKLKKFAEFISKYATIDGNTDGGKAKATFGRLGKQALKQLAEYIGLSESKVDFNKAGVAVSGDLTLMGMFEPENGIYISYNKDGIQDRVLYRTITHMKDYSGGQNNYFHEIAFAEPERIKEKIESLTKQAEKKKPETASTPIKRSLKDFTTQELEDIKNESNDKATERLKLVNEWSFHNTKTGFMELKPDAPHHVRVAEGIVNVKGELMTEGLEEALAEKPVWIPATVDDLEDYLNNSVTLPAGAFADSVNLFIKESGERLLRYSELLEKYELKEAGKPLNEYDTDKLSIALQKALISSLEAKANQAAQPANEVEEMEQELEKANNRVRTIDLLINGNWFKENPTKILGEKYDTTDRFKKPVTKVRGNIDTVIQGIDVPAVDLPQEPDQPFESDIKPDLKVVKFNDVQKSNLDKVIESTRKQHTEEAIKEKYGEPIPDTCPEEYYCFEQIMEQYNKGISEEEIKAWVWYKRITGGYNDEATILNKNNGWSKYVIPLTDIPKHRAKWLEEGIVCYHKGEYVPSVLYYAENIYEKQAELLRSKEDVIDAHGEEQYNKQYQGLENVKPPKLTLADPQIDNRLVINPKSDFAKEQKINALTDGTMYRQHNAVSGEYQDEPKSLLEAFKEWLGKLPSNAFKISNAIHIRHVFINGKNPTGNLDKDEKQRIKRKAKLEGIELFAQFLADGISRDDQLRIEQLWNSKYNGYVEINYNKIPVAFTSSSTFKNKPLFIREAQREGIGFISVHGTGCVAYDVGVGKTMTAILALGQALESGQCQRPLIVVPNQTYTNWINEIRGEVEKGEVVLTGVLPQYQVNDLYNLGATYIEQLQDKKGNIEQVQAKSITVLTYEGFNRLAFNEETWNEIKSQMYDILNQGSEKDRDREKLFEKIDELMGQGIKGGMVNIEDLGFDYLVIDEAHVAKKSFTQVKGNINAEGKRNNSPYQIRSGTPSMIALRAFMVSQFILRQNNMRNVMLLTATPFTNSPLEIYSMLALIGYQQLERSGIKNIKEFFDQYIKTSVELVINAKLKPERKEVVLGFNNLIALQQLIFKFINYKTGEDANIQRPNKIVLPLQNKLEGGEIVPLPEEDRISTNLPMNQTQRECMSQIEAYVRGEIDLMELCVNPFGFEEMEEGNAGEEVAENAMSESEEDSARILRALSFASQLALNPYLYACNPAGNPTAKEFIESSPKFSYTIQCIKSVKDFAEKNNVEMPGQVIYSNAGVAYFKLIKEYLVDEIGFTDKEVGIIKSGMSATKKNAVKDKFNAGEVKVLIGSATIKEGINLQYRSTDLYDLWLDWNPTDVKQLEGRIWRPGNRYANVRITFPLMEDSIDIFKFQKLQEKTSRINEIWHRAGRANTLKLEEVNPAELKKGLITDPHTLAELMIMEDKELMQDEINSLVNQKEVLNDLNEAREMFNKHIDKVKDIVESYKPAKQGRKIDTIFNIYKQWLDDPETSSFHNDQQRFDEIRKANYKIQSGIKSILAPRGLGIDFNYEDVIGRIEKDIEDKKTLLEDRTGEEAINVKAQEIIAEREKNKIRTATVAERVQEFAKLNKKVITETVLDDKSERRQKQRKTQKKRGADLELSADILADIAEMEAINEHLQTLASINAEMEAIGEKYATKAA